MKSKPPVEEENNHLTAVDCSFPAEIQQFPQMQVKMEQASLSFSEAYISFQHLGDCSCLFRESMKPHNRLVGI